MPALANLVLTDDQAVARTYEPVQDLGSGSYAFEDSAGGEPVVNPRIELYPTASKERSKGSVRSVEPLGGLDSTGNSIRVDEAIIKTTFSAPKSMSSADQVSALSRHIDALEKTMVQAVLTGQSLY